MICGMPTPEITRVVLMKSGRVFRDGPKRENLTSENLTALFGIPVEAVERAGYYQVLV